MPKKFLDQAGLSYFASKYPDNEFLETVVNVIGEELDTKVDKTTMATSSSAGLMSATDKEVLDNLNPNVAFEVNPLTNFVYITNAKREDLINCLIRFEPQIGTPIRTSNLLDVSNYTPGYYIGSSGSNATNANDNLGPFIPVSPGQDIYYTGIVGATTSSSINRRLHVYNSNQTWIKQMSYAGNLKVGNSWSTHGVVPSNGAYVRVSWGSNDTNVMISVDAPTKYEPYQITPYVPFSTAQDPGSVTIHQYTGLDMLEGQDYTINLPAAAGALYAYRIDPTAGKLIVTSGLINSYNGETLPGIWYSDRDEYTEGATPTTGAQVVYALNEEDFVEYDLTPLTIPLYYHNNYFSCENGTILSFIYYAETLAVAHITLYDGMRFGHTNIAEQDVQNWQSGVVQIAALQTAKADLDSPTFIGSPRANTPGANDNSTRLATTQYVQTKLSQNVAHVEGSNKASQNYSVGDYLCFAGQFYKVTSAITTGTTLTPGSNIEATSIANELALILAQLQ